MKALIDQFLRDISVVKDEKGNINIDGKEVKLIRLLESDKSFYRDVLVRWSQEKLIPKVDAKLRETLGQLEENQKRFDDLARAVVNGNAVPFIGSGMSSTSGLPMWTPFIERLADECSVKRRIDNLLVGGDYEKAAEVIEQKINRRMFDRKIKEAYNATLTDIKGPVWFLPFVFSNVVFTTNFDNLLERVYLESGVPFNDVVYGNRHDDYSELRSPESHKMYLVKLHGTYDKPSTRVLTKVEYDRNYIAGGTIQTELTHLISSKSVIFIGCSLSNDRTMQLIKAACDNLPNIRENFAFLKAPPDSREKLRRDTFLSERNIFPIWYEGEHDELIEALLVGLIKRMNKLSEQSIGSYI